MICYSEAIFKIFYKFSYILIIYFYLIYRSVQDIDLVTGALSEAPIADSVLGPTFLCLLGRTFRNIRLGKYSLVLAYYVLFFLMPQT